MSLFWCAVLLNMVMHCLQPSIYFEHLCLVSTFVAC